MASFSSVFAPVKAERQGEEEAAAASFLRVLVYPHDFETCAWSLTWSLMLRLPSVPEMSHRWQSQPRTPFVPGSL